MTVPEESVAKNKMTDAGKGTWDDLEHVDDLKAIVDNLSTIYKDQIALERAIEKYTFIVNFYQVSPQLLDPHFEPVLVKLLEIVRNPDVDDELLFLAFKLWYLFTKMRGYKVMVRLMPHEVSDLEPVLALLAKQDPGDFAKWENRYMLLLWLSMVCMVPFDMHKLDSNAQENRKPIMDRIIEIGKTYLCVSDKSRDAAAYMLSRFMTRHDVKNQQLPQIMDWAFTKLKEADLLTLPGMTEASGIMATMALLFKHGKREDLLNYAGDLLKLVLSLGIEDSSNTVLRKMTSKIVQRIGLVFLKAKVAAWRYQRGKRSLLDGLSNIPKDGATDGSSQQLGEIEEDEDYDVPEQLEEVIEYLLITLKDKDTVVRWSAAKGIGRVTGRLPRELANEVVGSIMELFSTRETDAAWHGACLALAELGRRGLLLPQRLPSVVPVIVKALNFDEKRGYFSVGSHVRDAACFVCWAFARAYDPEEMLPHVQTIASALLIVSVFDREVNVRRAAGAAFQENVGRQGQFPHGIDIVTTCDYFAVGNRITCYSELSAYLGQFEEYTTALIDHLVEIKSNHWDIVMREQCSEALHILTKFAPDYMSKTILPKLIELCLSMDLNQRHGAIIATSEITHALSKLAITQQRTVSDVISQKELDAMANIVKQLQDGQLFRGASGELMRKASCALIDRLSQSNIPVTVSVAVIADQWQWLIDDCLQHIDPTIQAPAIAAIPAFFHYCYREENGAVKLQIQERIIETYLQKLRDNVETTRMGFVLAIGAFPNFMLAGKVKVVLAGLIHAIKAAQQDKMAEFRRDAIKAITSVCLTAGVSKSGRSEDVVNEESMDAVFDSLFEALHDYRLDSRGDVGAWVREASLSGLCDLIIMLVKNEPSLLTPNISRTMFVQLVQQAVEKIDRTRVLAGEIFERLLYHDPEIAHVPCREKLQEIFPKDHMATINWAAPGQTFPRFTRLLALSEYRYNLMLGLIVSVGGLTESLVNFSGDSLISYLAQIRYDKPALEDFMAALIQVFTDHSKVDRVTIPIFKMFDFVLSRSCLDHLTKDKSNTLPVSLFAQFKEEVKNSGSIPKLLASVDSFCGLLQFEGEVRKKSLSQLCIFLCHRFPIVRKTSANKMYECILMYEDIVDEEKLEDVMTLLSETQWDKSVAEVRPIRNQLCEAFDIPVPVVVKKVKENTA